MVNPAGVDAGASLCKVVLPHGTEIGGARFPASDLAAVVAHLRGAGRTRIMATGGGAARLVDALAGLDVTVVPEFEAWGRGVGLLAARAGIELPPHYLLVSLGTGTSVLSIEGLNIKRVGGSALGGGTLLGLGRLLLGVETFAEICALGARGDRTKVDLLVGDIYPDGELPLPKSLNAASFGKLESRAPEDVAHALLGLIAENLGLICGTLARSVGAQAIVYCGSTLDANPSLIEILTWVTTVYGAKPIFLPDGAFCGALGASALAAER